MPETLIGLRIRERRRAAGLRQADLAAAMGISPSYLNLIERSKRRASPGIVARAARALALDPAELDGAVERRLADRLAELAAEADFADLALDPDDARDLLGRHPDWARALVRAWTARSESLRAVEALSDRLAHDPALSATLHAMLDRIAAIRSASEILASVEDIEPAQRSRFHRLLEEESGRLSEVAGSLAQFFDSAHRETAASSPAEEVEEAFLGASNRFAALEPSAPSSGARAPLGEAPPPARDAPPIRGADRRGAPGPTEAPGMSTAPPWTEVDARLAAEAAALDLFPSTISVDPGARRLALAEALAEAADGAAAQAVIVARPRLVAPAVARRARQALLAAAADARLAPADLLLSEGEALGWDLDALAERFALPPARLARRLTALPEPAPRAAFLRVNAAGQALERRLLPGLALPRLGAACPLWAVYRALSEPGRTLRQLAAFPRGDPWIFVARADPAGSETWPRRAPLQAILLALPAQAAARTLYAAAPRETPEPVGPNCRICPRDDCAHRAEDPVLG